MVDENFNGTAAKSVAIYRLELETESATKLFIIPKKEQYEQIFKIWSENFNALKSNNFIITYYPKYKICHKKNNNIIFSICSTLNYPEKLSQKMINEISKSFG